MSRVPVQHLDDLPGLPAGLVWLALLLLPVNLELVLQRNAGPDDALHRVSVTPEDPVLIALALLIVAYLLQRKHRPQLTHPVCLSFVAVVLAYSVALAVTPSWRGVQAVIRLIEAGALAAGLVWVLHSRWRSPTLFVLAAVVCAQAGLAVAQKTRGSVVGLTAIGEFPPLLSFGDALAGKGSFTHPYLLAGLSVVAATALALTTSQSKGKNMKGWLLLAMFAAVPLGITYARMSVLAMLLVAILLIGPRRPPLPRLPAALTALLLGSLIPAAFGHSGWINRATQDEYGGSSVDAVDAFSSGRVTFIKQAMHLWRESPWFGVGPGQYMSALARYYRPPSVIEFPVHDVPLLLATEGGLLTALAVAVFGVSLGAWALRSGRRTSAICASYLPFLLLDHPISHPQGVCTIALWLGLVLHSGEVERANDKDPKAPPYAVRSGSATPGAESAAERDRS